jgi:predicted transcriptional regulator
MKMKELTKAEEEVMQILWDLQKAFVKEIIAEMPEPKPAYNTVSTIVRILEQKELVAYKAFGKSHQYYPLITKDAYSEFKMKSLMRGYFSGSLSNMVSFFVEKNELNSKELDALLNLINQHKK